MYIVITVRFSQSSYSVNEDFGIVQPVLVLSNPSSFIETVRVTIANISANGMLSLHTYIHTILPQIMAWAFISFQQLFTPATKRDR